MRGGRLKSILGTARGRTLLGMTIGVLFIPVMLGVLACFELATPVGDPERGWVDPRLTGVWLYGDPVPTDESASLWLFDPYDARTWLVAIVVFDDGTDGDDTAAALPATEPAQVAGEASVPETEEAFSIDDARKIVASLAEDGRAGEQEIYLFKAWLTSIDTYRYLVMEPKLAPDAERGLKPSVWWVFRLTLDGDRVRLFAMDTDVEKLGELKSRGPAEQVIARHASDPEFFAELATLHPVPRDVYGTVAEVLERAGLTTE